MKELRRISVNNSGLSVNFPPLLLHRYELTFYFSWAGTSRQIRPFRPPPAVFQRTRTFRVPCPLSLMPVAETHSSVFLEGPPKPHLCSSAEAFQGGITARDDSKSGSVASTQGPASAAAAVFLLFHS